MPKTPDEDGSKKEKKNKSKSKLTNFVILKMFDIFTEEYGIFCQNTPNIDLKEIILTAIPEARYCLASHKEAIILRQAYISTIKLSCTLYEYMYEYMYEK